MSAAWDSFITVGRVIRPHGIQGAVVVAPETDFPAIRFAPGAVLQWNRRGDPEPARVAESREFRGRWVVRFDGVTTMNEAETLRDLELRIPPDEAQALAAEQYYVHQLEGCQVVTTTGEDVGPVRRVDFGSSAPLLVVDDGDGGEVLIPLVDGICRRVDVGAKRIEVTPLEGLINLNRRS